MKSHQLTPRFIQFNSNLCPAKGCWLWKPYRQSSGYGQIRCDGKMTLAHRLSWVAHNGPIPQGLRVLHKCHNRPCVNPDHLFLGTQKDIVKDPMAKQRMYWNLAHTHSRAPRLRKLTDDDVRFIRKSDWKLRELADMFGCSITNISLIISGKRKQNVSAKAP